MTERFDWIDYLKTIGILAVILGHTASPLGDFIYSWHMPLFFMLAGFFIKTDIPMRSFIEKDAKRLLIPYFIFAIFGVLIEAIKRVALNREGLDYLNEAFGVFLWMDMGSLSNTYALVLWFLPVLFFARLIVYLVHEQIHKGLRPFIMLTMFYASFLVDLPFGVDNALNSVLFVYIGFLYYKNYKKARNWFILLSIVVGGYCLFFQSLPSLDLATKTYGLVYMNVLWACSFFVLLAFIFQVIKLPMALIKLNRFWAQNTMIIFIIHPYTNNFAYIFNEKLLGASGGWQYIFSISVSCLVSFVSIKVFLERKKVIKVYV